MNVWRLHSMFMLVFIFGPFMFNRVFGELMGGGGFKCSVFISVVLKVAA